MSTDCLPSQNYLARNYGIRPDSADNGPALTALISTVRGTTGGRIWFEPAPYDIVTPVTDVGGSPVEFIGSGVGATYLRAAGSLITSGDMFTLKRKFRMFNLTLGATSVRAAGSLVKINGDMLVATVPAATLTNWEFGDVSMENGFDGVTLADSAGPLGVCGFFWDGGHSIAHGFAAGGTVFHINTPNGVINTINNVTHGETSNLADAARPAATVRVQGCADFRMHQVESFYCKRGLVIDPPNAGRAATVFMSKCIWGAATQEAVYINPNAGAESHSIEMTGGYIDNGGMYLGASAKAVYVANVTILGVTPNDGIRLDGCSGNTFVGMNFAGGNAKAFHAMNNAKNFLMSGNFRNTFSNNTVGVHIEAGCDKYQINTTGSEYCTTPLTEPTPGASSTVLMY
jgi:hypothetical protein